MPPMFSLDEDLARRLGDEARRTGKSFSEVLNDAVRRGLAAEESDGVRKPFRVHASPRGFQPGIDPGRLNQLSDQLELDRVR